MGYRYWAGRARLESLVFALMAAMGTHYAAPMGRRYGGCLAVGCQQCRGVWQVHECRM